MENKDEDDSRFFSSETMQAGRATPLKYRRKNQQPRILYPVKLSFKNEGKILLQTYKS